MYGYDAIGAVIAAIEKVCAAGGDPTDRATVRDAVMSHQGLSMVRWARGRLMRMAIRRLTDMTGYVGQEREVRAGGHVQGPVVVSYSNS